MKAGSVVVYLILLGLVCLNLAACETQYGNISPVPSISDQQRARLSRSVDCSTAKRDIAVLEKERASVGRQAVAGVRSVMPISAAAGILTGDYSDRYKVATGKYNDDINAKIDEIRAVCKVR